MDFSSCKNVAEILLYSRLEDMLPRLGCCTCERCVLDIAAIALNNTKPKYVVSREGELFMKMDSMHSQCIADITANIIAAADIVSKRPRHN